MPDRNNVETISSQAMPADEWDAMMQELETKPVLTSDETNWVRKLVEKSEQTPPANLIELRQFIKENYERFQHSGMLADVLSSHDSQGQPLIDDQNLRDSIQAKVTQLTPKNIPINRRKLGENNL